MGEGGHAATRLGARWAPKLRPLFGGALDDHATFTRDPGPDVHHLPEGPLLQRNVGILAVAFWCAGNGLANPDPRVDSHVA